MYRKSSRRVESFAAASARKRESSVDSVVNLELESLMGTPHVLFSCIATKQHVLNAHLENVPCRTMSSVHCATVSSLHS